VLGTAGAELSAGVDAAAQLCGTDNAPREAAWPNPAVAEPPTPKPAEPNAPTPAPRPAGNANPGSPTSWPTALRAGANALAICSREEELKMPALDVDTVELKALSNVEADVDDDDGGEMGTESCCSALGIVAVSADEVAWVSVVIDVPVA
jgi:hypothetical protein